MGLPNILMMEVEEKVPVVSVYPLGSTVYIRSELSVSLACVKHTTKNHDVLQDIGRGCHPVLVDHWGKIWCARA